MITTETIPRCCKCNKPAMTTFSGLWFCGDHAKIAIEKLKEREKEFLLTE